MKNSIEEDIRNAEHFINSIKTDKEYKEENGWHGYYNKEIVELARMLEHILSDYKRVLKENEIYKKNSEIMSKENLSTAEQLKVEIKENFRLKNQLENNRKEYQETYKDVREELKELKKENEELKFKERRRIIGKYGEVEIHDVINRTLSNDYISVKKIKDKIEKEIKYHEKNILDIENITMLKGKTAKEEAEIEFNKYAIVVLKKMLQELLEGRK